MLNFWDTVRGHETAEAIIRLAKGKKQYVIKAETAVELVEQVEAEITKGHRYISHIHTEHGEVAIMER